MGMGMCAGGRVAAECVLYFWPIVVHCSGKSNQVISSPGLIFKVRLRPQLCILGGNQIPE